jgi:hypothetical protein
MLLLFSVRFMRIGIERLWKQIRDHWLRRAGAAWRSEEVAAQDGGVDMNQSSTGWT